MLIIFSNIVLQQNLLKANALLATKPSRRARFLREGRPSIKIASLAVIVRLVGRSLIVLFL